MKIENKWIAISWKQSALSIFSHIATSPRSALLSISVWGRVAEPLLERAAFWTAPRTREPRLCWLRGRDLDRTRVDRVFKAFTPLLIHSAECRKSSSAWYSSTARRSEPAEPHVRKYDGPNIESTTWGSSFVANVTVRVRTICSYFTRTIYSIFSIASVLSHNSLKIYSNKETWIVKV